MGTRTILGIHDRITIELEDTDGSFIIDYDSKHDGTLKVLAELEDTDGREGVIYCEEFAVAEIGRLIDSADGVSRYRVRDDEEYHTIGVDLPDVLTDGGKLLETMREYRLWFELVQKFGPGGGNPYCHLRGKVADLRRWLIDVYIGSGDEPDEVEFCLWGDPPWQSGRRAEFNVTMHSVFTREIPEGMDPDSDEFRDWCASQADSMVPKPLEWGSTVVYDAETDKTLYDCG